MLTSSVVLAYFGPETVLPVTSIVATVIGVVMMMGRNSLRWTFEAVKRAALFCFRRGSTPSKTPAPHATPSVRQEAVETR
jgi:hypothetical protein